MGKGQGTHGMTSLGSRSQWLIGIGLLLGLVVAALLVSSLVSPVPGLAAPGTGQLPNSTGASAIGFTEELSHSIYFPFVSKPIVPNIWQAEYYANPNLGGEALYTSQAVRVDHDWGEGAPSGLPSNSFSIRWTGYWHFEVGVYTFFAFADDGVRLWLDDQRLINAWTPGRGTHQATITVGTAGLHHLKLEYFENIGDAAIRLHWRRTDLYPQWHGDYYNQPWVESGKLYSQVDSVIQFDWGEGAPLGLPTDGFSVAWKASRVFEPGTHRIFLYADDGYQLFVDGNKVGEGGWYDGQGGGAEDAVYSLEASATEYHNITYNFHDRGSVAEARLWIEYMERPRWTVEYYNNMYLVNPPIIVDDADWIFSDWKLSRPRKGMPSDRFSIRWSGQRYFHAGCYRFALYADDGVRLWVDGELLVNEWHAGIGEYHSPVTYLDTGYHTVVVEYFEDTGGAEIRFWWE
jgi:hypothetical protein